MKIYAIRDHEAEELGDLAYLFYYEKVNEYYIEISEGIDAWSYPFVLDTYVRRGQYTVSMADSLRFISQRIIPPDRQNIGMILKENGLEEYDEMKLLILAEGRCAQDECYIHSVHYDSLPEYIRRRRDKCMIAATSDSSGKYLVGFMDGTTAIVDLSEKDYTDAMIQRLQKYANLLGEGLINHSGTEILFPNGNSLTYEKLQKRAIPLPLTLEHLLRMVQAMIVSTSDLTEMLNCSRQNINDLVKRGRIQPLSTNTKEYLFPRQDVMELL